MTFFFALLETPNFKFEAVGSSSDQALELLEEAWSRHFDEHGQPDNMLSFDAVVEAAETATSRYSLTVRELELGAMYRDGIRLA